LNHFDFFKHDLNLLVAFDALYVEKSVSGAAKKMGVSQSAMSQSLRRLRAAFDDELFIRAPRGMEPTQGAQALSDPLREILLQVHKLLIAKSVFVPTDVERVFTLTMSDSQQLLLLPGLLEAVSDQAPLVTLRTIPLEGDRVGRQLDDGELDVAISHFSKSDVRHPTEDLFEERHVCLFNPKLVKVRGRLSLEDYLRFPHLLLTYGSSLSGVVDEQLAATKNKRRVIFTTPYAQAIPLVLERVAAIGIVPGRLAAHCATAQKLVMATPPVKLIPYQVSMKWHARTTNDPGVAWLRALLKEVATDASHLPTRR
jgi:LysR family transcriptional regulator, mexEF-oprN operon transcriptional activator